MQPPSHPACWPQCSCYYLITRISVTGHSTHILSQWQPSVRCTVSNYMRMNGWCHHWNWAFLSCSYFYECLKIFLRHGTDQSMENRWSWLGEFESFAAWSAWNVWFPNRILYFSQSERGSHSLYHDKLNIVELLLTHSLEIVAFFSFSTGGFYVHLYISFSSHWKIHVVILPGNCARSQCIFEVMNSQLTMESTKPSTWETIGMMLGYAYIYIYAHTHSAA